MPIYKGSTKVTPYHGGKALSRVYRGTSLVWQGMKSFSYDFEFQDLPNIWWAPISGFDSRTHASAPQTPAYVYNDMLVAPDSSHPAYLNHLLNRQVSGDVEWIVTLGDALHTRDYPSSITIASTRDSYWKIAVDIGSNGVEAYTLQGSNKTSLGSRNRTLSAGDEVRIVRTGNQLTFYHNGALWAHIYDIPIAYVDGYLYTGFGVMSTAGQWSSRIDRIRIIGESEYDEQLLGRANYRRLRVARNVWTEISAVHVNTPGTYRIQAMGVWGTSSSSTRQFRVKVNGQIVHTGSSGSTYLTVPSAEVGYFQWVTVEALSAASNTAQRDVTGGTLELLPA